MKKPIRVAGMGKRGPLPGNRRKMLKWIRHRIAVGILKPGDRLPDRKALCRKFEVSICPVQMAMNELIADGFVKAVSGHGTLVADPLPYAGKYLLLLRSRRDDAGVNLFAPALRAAAAQVAAQRKVSFDVKALIDEGPDSVPYAELKEEIRRHRYAGVFLQGTSELTNDTDVVTNINDVPMVYFGKRTIRSQGDRAIPLRIWEGEGVEMLFGRHCADCRRHHCRRVAVIAPWTPGDGFREVVFAKVKEHGLEVVANGFHVVDMSHWDERQFRRLCKLFLSSDAGRAAEAVVLGDDNLLLPFAECCREALGAKAGRRYFVSCHCNFPLLPKCDFPSAFHGPDLVDAISSFVDYADDCRAGMRKPRPPRLNIV